MIRNVGPFGVWLAARTESRRKVEPANKAGCYWTTALENVEALWALQGASSLIAAVRANTLLTDLAHTG